MSLAIAKCSEPVSKITLTGFSGDPMNRVPIQRLSGLLERAILIWFSPVEAVKALLLCWMSSSLITFSAAGAEGDLPA
jgi:hypothetical protein